ncbi:O-antigen ligase family protein [Aliivibrio sp. S2TY2]|uniref:O-antigen ligase family protein n=1 Tax=unclassified Aliivibrio TaxID=2645654 RepID=UPI0023795FAE|nr:MULTISPECIES: O-antigen ligase family protein [unclassified Aliivibrio]MDD9174989.1 O-antigen ligase family protein [Aliivibrio sp. S3TY1]MDD9192064.1 O-antigen ligase family protein [Aliivibrio sp. S2TY2]
MSSLNIRHSSVLNAMLFLSLVFLLIGHNLYDRKILFLNFSILLLFNLKLIPDLFIRMVNNHVLFIIIAYCIVSATWSYWAYQSLEESMIQLMLVLTCMMVANKYSTKTIFDIFRKSTYFIIAINLIALPILLGSAFGDSGMMGIYGHKNHFGLVIALCLIVLTFDYIESRSKITFYFCIVGFFLLFLSTSKTSILLYLLVITLAISISTSPVKFAKHTIISTKIALIGILIALSLIVITNRYEILDYLYYHIDESFMTSRGKLWLNMLLHAEDKIIYGFGFNSVWGKSEFSEIYFSPLFESDPIWVKELAASDSGYVDLILSLGIVGCSIFIYFIISTLISLIYIKSSRYFPVMFSLFLFVTLHNITETSFLLSTNILWYITILISFLRYNEEKNLSTIDVKIIERS